MILSLLGLFLMGLIVGSFLNSLIYRWYNNLSLWGFSFCPECKKRLQPRELIPLLSFLWLGGKCRHCSAKINWQYFAIELATGVVFALFYFKNPFLDLALARDLIFATILLFVLIFDLKYLLILDKVIYPAIIIGCALNLLSGMIWWDIGGGVLIGWLFFFLQFILTKGKGIGFGDVKFGILIGCFLGWQLTVLAIILAYLIGGIVASILLLSRKKSFGDLLPMGTLLAFAALIVMLWGEQILKWYFL